ncbi:Eukaryotic_translation initiation factor 3 [Hexamita inflata]|uniref:Serine-threonine kinase receptor-associated protein n=1 Tax=Hexamita inflata TaxID=28002 RepID=A0AA86UAV5_9EUKA|nr:Eukaryotic translation initiation factor 3 [Hexamita inflata]
MNKVTQKVRKLIAHARPVLCGEYSTDGSLVFTAGQDSIVNVICAYSGEILEKYGPHITATGTAIRSMAASSDSRYIALGLNYERIIIHDRSNKNRKMEQNVDSKGVRVVLFSKNSNYLYVCTAKNDKDKSAVIKYQFTPDAAQILTPLMQVEFEEDFKCAVLASDDSQIWFGTEKSIICLNAETLENLFSEDLNAPVCDLQIYKDAFVCCPIADSFNVFFYSMRELADIFSIKVHNRVNTAAPHPMINLMVIGGGLDPKLVAKTKEGNNVLTQYYDMINKRIILEQEVHAAPTHKLRWSPDGLGLLSVSEDGSIAINRFGEELLQYKWENDWTQ